MTVQLLDEQTAAKKEIDKRTLIAFGLVFASLVLYPFLFVVTPGGGLFPLLVLLGWLIAIVFSFVNVVKTVRSVKYEWLRLQAEFVQRWLQEIRGYNCKDATHEVDVSLVVGQTEVIKNLEVAAEDGDYGLLLVKDEVGDKKKLNFYWYTSSDLKQRVSGTTYLVAETDFSHRLFKQFDTHTTLLEWGQFEDLLHVETTVETEARYLLPPDVMEKIYNTWTEHRSFLSRMKFSNGRLSIVTGLKKLNNNDENITLLHDDSPKKLIEALKLLRSLEVSVLGDK